MTDIKTPEERSLNMAAVKSRDTKPELLVRRALHAAGFRYTLRNRKYPGNPDIVLPKYRTAIFINGCFWHGHDNCRYFRLPQTNTEFWSAKIHTNKERDARVIAAIAAMDWHVITIWECELRTKEKRAATLHSLITELNSTRTSPSSPSTYTSGGDYDSDIMIAAEP